MTRSRLLLGLVIAGLFVYGWLTDPAPSHRPSSGAPRTASESASTWGDNASLRDHFARHGRDFGAASATEYAGLAAQFLQRAKAEELPTKVDEQGVLRIYDPVSGAFGAYNSDGTTKTFFKPGDASYFDRQPGRRIDLKRWR